MARTAALHRAPTKARRAPEIDAYLDAVRRSKAPNAYVAFLGVKTYDTPALHRKVKEGLSFGSFEKLARVMAIPMNAAAEILFIPNRTLQRRKAEGRLRPDESDRLVRLSRIFGKAVELFEGDSDAAMTWLASPVKALGGTDPLDMTKTEPGALEVEHLIGRLEHGVFS